MDDESLLDVTDTAAAGAATATSGHSTEYQQHQPLQLSCLSLIVV